VAEELQDAEREVASWEVRVAGMHMARTRLENEQQQLQAHIAGLEAQLSEVKERIRAREPEILDLSKRKDFISGQIMSKKLQLQAHEGKLKRLTSVLTELKANQERIRAQLDELTSASAELELKAREELGRGWKELLNGDLAEDPEAALNEIRNRQRRLVLPDQDIELEHREVSRRLRAIEEQMADISEAAETLSSKIKELEIRLRSGWKSGFKALNGYVTEIWCELFGGGSAELLEDEDGGVRLEATPPGKRIKSLTSLSGGERALASMTLVISMLKAGSFPVCVLDEVDAALDDLRAARLATVLGRLANQVQFVIVTHNRHTIQACQALYGFAVDGQGSTKVISLKVWHPQEA
jgi:chromosome segregation protein